MIETGFLFGLGLVLCWFVLCHLGLVVRLACWLLVIGACVAAVLVSLLFAMGK